MRPGRILARLGAGAIISVVVAYRIRYVGHAEAAQARCSFYRTSAGREPVRDWLRSLSRDDRKIIGDDIDAVQFDWPLGRPLVDHLRNGIWEVRSHLDNRHARVLFAATSGEIVLLHGFIKKTRATPGEDLELAERRWKIWQDQQQGEDDE